MPLAEPLACIFISWCFDESNVYIYILTETRCFPFAYRNFLYSYIYTYKRCLLHCKLTSIWYSNTYYRYISNHVTSRKLSANIKFIIISSFSNSNLRYRLFAFSIIVKRLLVSSFIFQYTLNVRSLPEKKITCTIYELNFVNAPILHLRYLSSPRDTFDTISFTLLRSYYCESDGVKRERERKEMVSHDDRVAAIVNAIGEAAGKA